MQKFSENVKKRNAIWKKSDKKSIANQKRVFILFFLQAIENSDSFPWEGEASFMNQQFCCRYMALRT